MKALAAAAVLAIVAGTACRRPGTLSETTPTASVTAAQRDSTLPRGARMRLGTPARPREEPEWRVAEPTASVDPRLGVPRRRWAPDEEAVCTAASADGNRLAAGFEDGTVTLWSGPPPRRERTLVGHGPGIFALAISAAGDVLVSASVDGEIRVWDARDGAPRHVLSMNGTAATELRFGDGGRTLLAASFERVRRWSLGDGRDLDPAAGHLEGVERVVVSPAGWAASSDGSGTILRWDLSTGERRVLAEHADYVTDLAVSPAGDVLVSTGCDHAVRFWKAGLPPSQAANGLHYYAARCVDFSPDGAVALVGDDWGQARAWRIADGELRWWWTLHQEAADWREYGVLDLAWAPDGRSFATGGNDGVLAVRTEANPDVALAQRELADARDLAFTPDGRRLLVRHGETNRIALLDAQTLATERESADEGWRSAAPAPSGEFVAAVAKDGDLALLRVPDLTAHDRVPAAATVAAFSSDGTTLVTGGRDGTLVVWDVAALLGRPATAPARVVSPPEAPVAAPPRQDAAVVEGLLPGETLRPYEGDLPGAEPDGVRAVLVLDGSTARPLAGAEVRVHGEPGRGFAEEPFASATTDEHGLARVRSDGRVQWVVQAPGRAPRSLLCNTAGPMTVLFAAPGAGGRVTDPFGRPLAGADVQWFLGCGHSPPVQRARTDADGRFRFPDAEPRAGGMLWIVGDGIASEYVDADVLWSAGLREATIATLPGLRVRGVLATPEGRPRPGWPLWSDQAYRGPLAFTAADGSFELPGFDPRHDVTLEEPGGRMLGEIPLAPVARSLPRRVVAPSDDRDAAHREARGSVPWPVRVVDEHGEPLRSGAIRLVAPETGAVFGAEILESAVESANAILRAPEGSYELTVGDPLASHAAGPVDVTVQRDADEPFEVVAASQAVLDLSWEGPRPEASLRLVVPGAARDFDDEDEDPVHLPRTGPAAVQVWVEEGQLNARPRVMRVFEVGAERDGRRAVRIAWTPPRLVRLTGLEGDEDARLDCGVVDVAPGQDGDAIEFETYAEGSLRVVVRQEDRRAVAVLDLDAAPEGPVEHALRFEPEPKRGIELHLPGDVLAQAPEFEEETWEPGDGFGASSSSSGDEVPGDGLLRFGDDGPQLARIAVEGWLPRCVPLVGPPGRSEVRWGTASLALDVHGPGGARPDVVAWIEGVLVTGEEGRVEVRGLAPGRARVLVGAKGCVPQAVDLEVSDGARRSVSLSLPGR